MQDSISRSPELQPAAFHDGAPLYPMAFEDSYKILENRMQKRADLSRNEPKVQMRVKVKILMS
ncbi:hypothetical protein [Methylobacter sp. BlB1]|uniref:hypothetical protein n=1 Tax=Methylobacter sp. BlB1 TaxID=2785914 RepID=UPI001893F7F9|nr:hypothetical protein [Methylobacter sp. BlB1]MBF6648855.1 hypothetical protein [Methylobacter sp. BlB1]